MAQRDSSPVYYREIQKHAYLKRMPDDNGGKLRPLVLKKPPLKPMWTQLCIHNGRTPYLEQYKDPASARAHRPAWRASLVTARHVTASVTPRDSEYDFLIDTQQGPVRMLAPNWDSMQEWVSALRGKLRELRIVPLCENEYAPPPARPPPRAPRAAARDPASPLPPTPPLPVDRVPGIDLSSVIRVPSIPETPPEPTTPETTPQTPPETNPEREVDISEWDERSLPSTSQAPTSVANICGQNICLDDSLLRRDESDEGTDPERDGEVIELGGVINDPERESEVGNIPSDCANVTVIAVSASWDPHPTNSESEYGAVFEPAYEHLSHACSAVRLQVRDATYEYLCPPDSTVSVPTSAESRVSEVPASAESRVCEVSASAESRVSEVSASAESRVSSAVPAVEPEASEREVTAGDADAEGLECSARPAAWRRGLTELALLGRRRAKRADTAPGDSAHSEHVTSRGEIRPDTRRRRSSSLSNGSPQPTAALPLSPSILCERVGDPSLQPLRARQALALARSVRRGAACVARLSAADPPVFCDYDKQVWIARWGASGVHCNGRAGDRLCAMAGAAPKHATHARKVLSDSSRPVDILFYRVPLAQIYVVKKRHQQSLGIKLDKECTLLCVEPHSAAARGGLPPAGRWALTEVNDRPLDLLKGGEEQMNRLSLGGTETSLLLQPYALVQRLRSALKRSR